MYLLRIIYPIIYPISPLPNNWAQTRTGRSTVRLSNVVFYGRCGSWADRLASAEEGGSQCMS